MTTELTQEEAKQAIEKLLKEIRDIVNNGNYIFRGENKNYGKISSKLYRYFNTLSVRATLQVIPTISLDFKFNFNPIKKKLKDTFGKNVLQEMNFPVLQKSLEKSILDRLGQIYQQPHQVDAIQKDFILQEVREYVDFENEIDTLVELQHYGGSTNLIDFSHDIAVSLFFACDGESEEDGRLIMYRADAEDVISPKKNQNNRTVFQKSVFVQRSSGYVDEKDVQQVVVPKNLKSYILTYVQDCFGLRTETIYGDLMGYVQNQEIHNEAVENFFAGSIAIEHKAKIEHYTKAIALKSNYAWAYNNRGLEYCSVGENDKAIVDLNKAIELNPKFSSAYNNRGIVYYNKRNYAKAIFNYDKAIEFNSNYAIAYSNRGNAYGKKGDYYKALADHEKAFEIDSSQPETYLDLGIAKDNAKDTKGALEVLAVGLQLSRQKGREDIAIKIQETIDEFS